MSSLKKSPLKYSKTNASAPVLNSNTNPFDSDDELDNKKGPKKSGKTSSETSLFPLGSSSNLFDDDESKDTLSAESHLSSAAKNRYKNDFRDSGGLENQTVQELENYAAYKAEETTNSVKTCLKIAEDIREDATKTLVNLHQQGEQLNRSHMIAADMDHNLSRGEKLLGSLGGIFSKKWKPAKAPSIIGPIIIKDDPVHRKGNHLEQRERLGLTSTSRETKSHASKLPSEPTNALQKVEVEKAKQDDALDDLSNIVGELKEMAIDMGSEIERHNKAMDDVQNDVDSLNTRVRAANQRTRRLLGR